MSDELRPCPFCGQSPSVETLSLPGGRKINTVECANPDCDTVLASIWNARPIEDALAGQLAELRERHEKLRKAGQGFLDICGSIKATDDAGIRAEITNRVSALRALDAALAAEEG